MVNLKNTEYIKGEFLYKYTREHYIKRAKDIGEEYIIETLPWCQIYICQSYTTDDDLCKHCTEFPESTEYKQNLMDVKQVYDALWEEESVMRCWSCEKYKFRLYHTQ
jgi:hypothetical protein